jgi:hypothetical protein
VDAIEQWQWIDSAVRDRAESRRFPHGGGFPSSSAFVTVDSWRGDGEIQRITSSCEVLAALIGY